MKVAVYMRFANDPKDEGKSLDLQELQLRQFAEENNLQVVKAIREYGSGLSCDRLGLNQLLTDTGFQGVLTKSYDRIGRDFLKTVEWQNKLKESGKILLCADGSHECAKMPWYTEIMKKSKKTARKR